MAATLYLVATPIGNLEDITLRALRLLKEVDIVAAEDTRQTRKLLTHFGIGTRLVAYHEHSGEAATTALVRKMAEEGQSVALVTDAGTPGISDPGVDLVRAAIDAGVAVSPLPGASTPIAALIASGLPTARFLFEGFLPRTRGPRYERLEALAAQTRTLIFFESPQRLVATIEEMARILGPDRLACVARELTKIHEEYRRGTLADILAHYMAQPPRGECCIVIHGRDAEGDAAARDLAFSTGEGGDWKDLIKRLAKETGLDRKDLYQAIVRLKEEAKAE
ncbi:MAG: 16S rRNA (cytidine(1402)-2'-O)-methyltransferase [Capsulimonadaceae bacterium]|nr:16S rRNA (cytidine(1402)-2'-O)-methyltransferase [Capsulimonadaceae bacterium]